MSAAAIHEGQSIDTAPKDGTVIRVKISLGVGSDMWSFRSKWLDGKWCANFGSDEHDVWQSFEPQPRFWRPS